MIECIDCEFIKILDKYDIQTPKELTYVLNELENVLEGEWNQTIDDLLMEVRNK